MIESYVVSLFRKLRTAIIGPARSITDRTIFHKLSLIAFFAWVGLGADGLSSSCYGPEEIFRVLQQHPHLSIFVALVAALTIFLISASYSQIIALFPSGGGGYLVASKLLSPHAGMVSGSSLLIDYVLTIAISIASGVDAFFSILPPNLSILKPEVAILGVLVLILMNLRGVKEAVLPLLPIFLIFLLTHIFAIGYSIYTHSFELSNVYASSMEEITLSHSQLGWFGMLFLMMRAYTMGAGTFTGIEAVSNGIPILREPKAVTAQHTMRYMAFSLAFMVTGLILSYSLYRVIPSEHKTLNAVLFESMSVGWNSTTAFWFVAITLFSETMLLFVAAQAGFLDGPRVLANMAIDRWVPTKFAALSDRLVNHNGILLMGIAAILVLIFSGGSVALLVVLYSINVFVTFTLSQLGMVRHWWQVRHSGERWIRGLLINGVGLFFTTVILISVIIIKFSEGGWVTLLLTGSVIGCVLLVRHHYNRTSKLLKRLDDLVEATEVIPWESAKPDGLTPLSEADRKAKTAVVLVNGYSGVGLHSFYTILREFPNLFRNFVFIMVGQIDAGNFKGGEELERLDEHVKSETGKYVGLARSNGFYAESATAVGTDVVSEITILTEFVKNKYPNAVIFGTQILFSEEFVFSRWLHNYTLFALQRRLSYRGIPLLVLPLKT